MSESTPTPEAEAPIFIERPTEFVIRDAFTLAAVPLALAGIAGIAGWPAVGFVFMGLPIFVAFFFRNPPRFVPEDDDAVCAPVDGRVLEVGEIETEDGRKMLRIGIFLSMFNVHVNRSPASGRVVAIERSGSKYRAAFDRAAEDLNVRVTMTLESRSGARFQVAQITGLIARRIVCFPEIGDFVRRGDRYGYIRFGSRTDVLLPIGAEPKVRKGDRVKGGESVVARFAGAA